MKEQNTLIPSDDELVARAESMISTLKKRARQCEADRSVPKATIDDFRSAGFFKIMQPVEFGGYGLPPISIYKVLQEVGRGCMSSAWVLMVLGTHSYEIGLMGREAGQVIWGARPEELIASSYAPFGKVEKVDGGYRVSGRWNFSSGIDHASWVILGGMVSVEGSERPDYRAVIVPAADFEIDQSSWHAFGLSGSGSKDITVRDGAFVPEHLSHSLVDARNMVGWEKLPECSRYPFWPTFVFSVASAIIGGARGGVDELIEQLKPRVGSFDRGAASMDPLVRLRLGRASTLIRGAAARIDTAMSEIQHCILRGQPPSEGVRVQFMADASQVGKDCEDAIITLYKATGARGLSLDNRIQSILRNVLAGTNHISMHVDGGAMNLGATKLGAEIAVPLC